MTNLAHDPIDILLAADALLFGLGAPVGNGLSPGLVQVDVSPEGRSDEFKGKRKSGDQVSELVKDMDILSESIGGRNVSTRFYGPDAEALSELLAEVDTLACAQPSNALRDS